MAKIPMSKMTPEELDAIYQEALEMEKYAAICGDDYDSVEDESFDEYWPEPDYEDGDDLDLEEFEENRRRRIAEANEY